MVTDAAKDVLIDKGFDHAFGARPLRRAIQNLIEDPLAEGMLHGRFQPGDTIVVDAMPDGGSRSRRSRSASRQGR